MTDALDPETPAFTRASVEAYLRAASEERVRLQLALVDARARTARAEAEEERLRPWDGRERRRLPRRNDALDPRSTGEVGPRG